MRHVTISGAQIKIYINGKSYGPAQSIQFTLDTGDTETYGIDSPFPQEIAPVRSACMGQVSGLRIGGAGGLQAKGIRDQLKKMLGGSYVTLRVVHRATGEDILYVPQARIPSENHSVAIKGTYKVSFAFRGVAGYQPLDRQ